MGKFHNEQLQRAFAAACGLPFQQPDPPPAAATEPPAVHLVAPLPEPAGGAPLSREAIDALTARFLARPKHAHPATPFERALDIARECWSESGGDIEEARVLALDLCGDDADELRAVREELDAIANRSDAEGYL